MRKIILAASALTLAVPVIPSAAMAHDTGYRHSHSQKQQHRTYCTKRSGTTGARSTNAANAPPAPCSGQRSAPCSAAMSSATC